MKVCEICGSNNKVHMNKKLNKIICSKHRQQLEKHGEIQESKRNSSNELIEYENYAEIILRDKFSNEKCRTIIDKEDISRVTEHIWFFNTRYVKSKTSPVRQLHKFLLGIYDNNVKVDHKDNNPLNNRKDNLRICTQGQNCCNRIASKTNIIGLKNISLSSNGKKYKVHIQINKNNIYLGSYGKLEEAEIIARIAREKYHGEFACHG